MILNWIKATLTTRTFDQHFMIDHDFLGIINHCIKESYKIYPKSLLGTQLLLEGVQFYDNHLHLEAKITVNRDSIHVSFLVSNPLEAKRIIDKIKKIMAEQLNRFEKRFYSDPVVCYVEKFCNQCLHYETKPLNQCILHCRFEPKVEPSKE
jgi:hypothetical protein